MVTVFLMLFVIASAVSAKEAEDGQPAGSDLLNGLRGVENSVQQHDVIQTPSIRLGDGSK